MKKLFLLILLISFGFGQAFAQTSFVGIQNSPRKGIISATMNPAEINNLHKKVDVNFFSLNGSVSNNIISFGDIVNYGDDVLDVAFQRADGPVNFRSVANILGPSVGIKSGNWAFGLTTQLFTKADIIDFDPTLGQSLLDIQFSGRNNSFAIATEYNQRINATGYGQVGFVVGREIFENDKHKFSVGATAKILIPAVYANVGMDRFRAEIVQVDTEVSITNATGSLNFSYSESDFNNSNIGSNQNGFNFGSPSGFGLDLGANYQIKDDKGRTKINTGLSIMNLGSMTFAKGQTNNTYTMNIPQGQSFRLDQLEGNFEEIENQLIASGFFTRTVETNGIRTNLPSLIAAYAEMHIIGVLHASAYLQQRFGNINSNQQLSSQNLFVITPRVVLGKFEIYSPWMQTEVAGFDGGLGLRYGGFFIGSNSILTGLSENSKQADFHMGLSWGFGRL
ncbi:DUF5723 family protein [Belliella kenyensis]|uniref:DUF5723 family protein n=1 Tax=Belliella kenyensis TaxID=1472724 RepID=A0ABV8EQR0_9BACT|nr:DUF5723 family protein [Belliella kenyensis]MCH7402125.1 DUF5723 family protein [Belliella kenyensis]MDN3601567.1 DUF5723 family protein [Belliella kenyensis]